MELAPLEGYSNLRSYLPQYPLYSDGASKQRWIYLPEGSSIDTSDPDEWEFPQGTILWKEFSLAGRVIETRQFEKTGTGKGASEWRASVYVWRADQSDADLMTNSFTLDASYEAFAYPDSYTLIDTGQCNTCHQSSTDLALGFSYLQLSADSLNPAHLQLTQLRDDNWLTEPPDRKDSIKGDFKTQMALGFLHANCATCHSPNGSASFIGTMNLKHSSSATSPPTENAWATTVGVSLQNSTGTRVVAGDPDQSNIYVRTQDQDHAAVFCRTSFRGFCGPSGPERLDRVSLIKQCFTYSGLLLSFFSIPEANTETRLRPFSLAS